MNDPYVIAVQGLDSANELKGMGESIELNIVRALNTTAARARTAAARQIREQVNLPASYLNRPDRLGITKKATRSDMETIITGRHRPTSLARFATSGKVGGKPGARVTVKPGLATFLPRAFFIRLRSGNTDGGPGNIGLAIRLPAGQRPSHAYKPTELGRNLWLLYGPAIDQVFDDVATEMSPRVANDLESEFLRLMNVGLK